MNTVKMLVPLFMIVLSSCTVSQPTVSETPKVQPRFDYASKVTNAPASTGITIALLNPQFAEDLRNINPFSAMRKNMSNDFEELLTSKGFKIRGPFEQQGELLYDDKLNSDFVFEVEVDLNFLNIDRKLKTISKINWGKTLNPYTNETSDIHYMYEGEGTISCNLLITAMSTNFGEKLWKKNISLNDVPFKYTGKAHWSSKNASLLDEIKQDNHVFNEISKLLESQYNTIFDLIDRQINVDEMKMISTTAKKVDKKE